MFTKRELEVMQNALSAWEGVYPAEKHPFRNGAELEYHNKMIECRDQLLSRVEEVLLDMIKEHPGTYATIP